MVADHISSTAGRRRPAPPSRPLHGYRAICYHTAGEIVVWTTAARRRADDDHATHREQVFADLDLGELPRLAGVADRWATLTAGDTTWTGSVPWWMAS